MNRFIRLTTLLIALALAVPSFAQTELSIPVGNDGVEIPISQYAGKDTKRPLFLWLPSDHGTSPVQKLTADKLARIGYTVWVADLHLAYFVDEGRDSLKQFPADDIAELIEAAAAQSQREIILMTSGRAAQNALEATRRYQLTSDKDHTPMQVAGVILFSPNVTLASDTPGQPAGYQTIAQSSNIPMYIIQPSISTNQWRAGETAEVLRSAGADVYLHRLPGIQSGFQIRPYEDLTPLDLEARADLPLTLARAARILGQSNRPDKAATLFTSTATNPSKRRFGLKTLKPYPADLELPQLDGTSHNIQSHQGRVSLISFWASWCDPCIKELPSLKRLYDDYHAKGLDIVTVNAGEDAARIQAAADQFEMNDYTLLMDSDGAALKAWNVYGFPTNFLVNRQGEVVFGSFGGIDWDEPEARAAVESLLQTNP